MRSGDCTVWPGREVGGGRKCRNEKGNPLMYLAAVAIGSAVGCVILGFLKKNAELQHRNALGKTEHGWGSIRELFCPGLEIREYLQIK